MRRLWLIFAQTVTVSLAVFFALGIVRPEWLDKLRTGPVFRSDVSVSAAIGKNSRPADNSFRDAAKKALPSVVHIYTTQKVKTEHSKLLKDPLFRHFFGDESDDDEDEQSRSGLGSGVIVSASGYILTNYHVIEGAEQIEVALNNGKTFKAIPVGGDPETDLAVLRLDSGVDSDQPFPAIALGKMDDVVVGDIALAIGNPFGVGQTVTMGIVSALGRSHLGINTFENFIQTDAAINPGNSGGALIDVQGNLIGINTAIYSRSGGSLGIGFAIPVSTAGYVMEQIIQHGSVTRGWIGIEAQEITEELAESFGMKNTDGALIAGVLRGSPAAASGVKPGDILVAVAGKPVKDPQVMLDLIAAQKPGDLVSFSLRRAKTVIETKIRVGKRPAPQPERQ